MLYEFTIKLSYEEIERIVNRLNGIGISQFYYDAPIKTVKIQNGYAYEEEKEGLVELKIYEQIHNSKVDLEKFIHRLVSELSIMRENISLRKMDEINWNTSFTDVDLGNGWVISYPPFTNKYEDKSVLKFDPQGAFGTGIHGTTQDCLRFILSRDFRNKHILDIGTGSGILSIATAMKNAKTVTAIDIERVEDQFYYNFHLNDVKTTAKVWQHDMINGSFRLQDEYDFIMINIGVDETLQIIDRHELFGKSSEFLISGVVDWYEDELQRKFKSGGFSLGERLQTDEWVTLYFKK